MKQRFKKMPWWGKTLTAIGTFIVVGIVGFILAVIFYPIPDANDVAEAQTSVVYYADGETPIGDFGEVKRISVPLSDVPEDVQYAVLAAEDRNFYKHSGFSISGITRAFWNNLRGGNTQGGSTITQQYVKNAFLSSDQTIIRKVKELILSVKLELIAGKQEILEGYLNTIYWGRGAYGIEAAAQAYFGIPASELTVEQGIALAGMIQAPSNYEPENNPEGIAIRFDYVKNGMVEEGWLTPGEAAELSVPEFLPPATGNSLGGQVGYIVEQAKREMIARGIDEQDIEGGGLRIITTIDQQGQESIERAVANSGPTSGTEGLRIGAIAVDPNNGGIIAMYGGRDYVQDQLNNATQARGQAGSTFKAFGLVAAFEKGIAVDSIWNGNSPRTFNGYTVPNLGGVSYGDITLTRATEDSVNTVFVDVETQTGVNAVIRAAEAAGIPPDTPNMARDLTFVLGTASPTTLNVTSAYATFAARGEYYEPTILREVYDNGGNIYYWDQRGQQRISQSISDTVNWTLSKVVTNGSGSRAQALGRPSAGKTGTTDNNLNAWYAGYTPQVSMAVSMSKEDAEGNPISLRGTGGLGSVAGGSFPAAIWTSFAQGYLQGKPVENFVTPNPWPGGASPAPEESPSESESESESPTDEESPSESESASPSESPSDTEQPSPTPTRTTPGPPEPTEEGDAASVP